MFFDNKVWPFPYVFAEGIPWWRHERRAEVCKWSRLVISRLARSGHTGISETRRCIAILEVFRRLQTERKLLSGLYPSHCLFIEIFALLWIVSNYRFRWCINSVGYLFVKVGFAVVTRSLCKAWWIDVRWGAVEIVVRMEYQCTEFLLAPILQGCGRFSWGLPGRMTLIVQLQVPLSVACISCLRIFVILMISGVRRRRLAWSWLRMPCRLWKTGAVGSCSNSLGFCREVRNTELHTINSLCYVERTTRHVIMASTYGFISQCFTISEYFCDDCLWDISFMLCLYG